MAACARELLDNGLHGMGEYRGRLVELAARVRRALFEAMQSMNLPPTEIAEIMRRADAKIFAELATGTPEGKGG